LALPEQGFCPQEVYAPVDETGELSDPQAASEEPQQDLFSESSLFESEQLPTDPLVHLTTACKKTDDVSAATDAVSAVTGGTLDNNSSSNAIGKLEFDYRQISENGMKLYNLLLGDIGLTKYLPELAQMVNIDLNLGLQELREYGLLDESNPNIILIISSRL